MRVLTICAVMLLSALAVADDTNLLKNADFAQANDAGAPVAWRGGGGVVTRADLPDGGKSVRIQIGAVATSMGELGQRLAARGNWNYRVSGKLRSEAPGLAMLQVKLFASGKEIGRLQVGAKSSADWKTQQLQFTTPPQADAIEVLCRYERNGASQGKWVEFAGLTLVAIGEKGSAPAKLTAFAGVSTFQSIGLRLAYEGDPSASVRCAVRYRTKGQEAWQQGLDLVQRPTEREFRGSLLNLQADTEYEVECDLLDPPLAATALTSSRLAVRTWADEVPIAKTIRLPAGPTTQPLIISDRGAADGWILYTSAEGAASVIDAGTAAPAAVHVKDAAFVVFENITVRGGAVHGVSVTGSNHVRFRRCDVSGWGNPGTPSDSLKSGRYVDAAGKLINWQAGVHVGTGSSQVVVEGNFIHAARGTANSWAYGHPAGPQAVILNMTAGNNVVRDNDLIGDQHHWWNDAIESMYNERLEGGPNHDTDISGNVIAFANDDGTELDGGQINVRFFNNWTQWSYCGVSCAPNLAGPSYVFRNLFVQTGEERQRTNFGFKMGGDRFKDPGRTFVLHNTMVSTNAGLSTGHYGTGATPITTRNNAYLSGEVFLRGAVEGNYDTDWDLMPEGVLSPPDAGQQKNGLQGEPAFVDAESGDYRLAAGSKGIDRAVRLPGVNDSFNGVGPDIGAFENGSAQSLFPPRRHGLSALPLMSRLHRSADGRSSSAEIELVVPAEIGTRWTAHANAEWLQCQPPSGRIAASAGARASAGAVRVTLSAGDVELKPGLYRAAVTFRTDAGYSRSVLVSLQVRHPQPFAQVVEAEAAETDGGFTKVADTAASGGAYLQTPADYRQESGGAVHFTFEVPADGVYYFAGLTRVPGPVAMTHDSFFFSINDTAREQWNLQHLGSPRFNWVAVAPPRSPQAWQAFELKKGRNRFSVHPREPLASLDAVRLSNEPLLPAPTASGGVAP